MNEKKAPSRPLSIALSRRGEAGVWQSLPVAGMIQEANGR
jgi:hypothetical protein